MRGFIDPSRRRFLAQAGIGLLAYAGVPAWLRAVEGMGGMGMGGMVTMPKAAPHRASPAFRPDVEIELICRPDTVSILPGPATRVLRYTGRLIHGPEGTLTTIPGSYLGPLMRLQTGQKVRIHLRNELSEPTITHWHGLNVPALMDGHPMYALDRGETFVYEFEIRNRAGMILYHPHTHGITGRQVYQGLAGLILLHDEEERALELPAGEYEIPIVIQDRRFDGGNQLVYLRDMHDRMIGFHGDQILINGRPDARFDVASRAYRLRILNGSNARIYKLAWDDGTPLTVIGVDGGLLEAPVRKSYVMLGPGERVEVWADFSDHEPGSELVMRSRPFTGVLPKMAEHMMHGAMGGMHGRMMEDRIPLGSDYPLFTFRVTRAMRDSPKLPTRLSTIRRYRIDDTANPDRPVPVGLSEAPMAMLINGRPYAPNDFLPSERIPFDTLQLIEIFHAHGNGHGEAGGMGAGQGMRHGMMGGMGGMGRMGHMRRQEGSAMGGMGMGRHGQMGMMGGMGMMMSMAHPIHFHEEPFQILSRTIGAEGMEGYATVREGFIDSGWKDTVLVMPGERVRLIKPFKDYKGVFMVHCHNLEHEDMGMMREFMVE
jgi:FtsP/CotA-like multicopper oxidase with cupredoxin domain